MLKKPGVLLNSYSKCHVLFYPPHYSVFTPNRQTETSSIRYRYISKAHHPAPSRAFATVRNEPIFAEDIQWPKTSGNRLPTPYQIFQQKRSDPYSKRRFYELVKLYHPDRHIHRRSSADGEQLARTVMVERYRLVLAANDILSHPDKRRAYDNCGAGWEGRPEHQIRWDQWSYHSDGRWSGFEDNNSSPFRNATWEDWERWYQRHDKEKKEPQQSVCLSNGAFLSLVAIVACLGGVGQATRIGDQKISYIKEMESINSDCTQSVRRRMEQAQGYDNRDIRVSSFMKAREEAGAPAAALDEETQWQLLPPPETR